MTEQTFVLPDVGEGLTEAEIVQWRVAPGDEVAVNDVLVEIETAKSLVELPSPFSGTVGELLATEGATVEVGAPIITIGSVDATPPAPAATRPSSSTAGSTRASISAPASSPRIRPRTRPPTSRSSATTRAAAPTPSRA